MVWVRSHAHHVCTMCAGHAGDPARTPHHTHGEVTLLFWEAREAWHEERSPSSLSTSILDPVVQPHIVER